jgi:acid phosphatase family membrane protein YuiD
MGILATIFTNKIILSVIAAYFVTSVIKILFHLIAYDELNLMIFFRTGGMPSSHAGSVSAMTTTVYLMEGFSNLFFVCIVLSSIIVSDAVGIRRAAGKQAQILNKMVEEFRYFKKFKTRRLYELLGHTPKQVLTGMVVGIITAKLIFII